MASTFDLGVVKGSGWYSGTAITGTSATGTVFASSGVAAALANDMYLNTATGGVYKCTLAGAPSVAKWAYDGSIKGLTGAQGPKGDTGAQGSTGAKGDTGAQGVQGVQGPAGATGAAGQKGDAGVAGPKGDTGAAGAKGATGATGPQGNPGPTPTFSLDASGHLIASYA